jgi:hypothetical protein
MTTAPANPSTDRSPAPGPDVASALDASPTTVGATLGPGLGPTLGELSRRGPLMLVFLRHFGCTFCREAMSDIREQRREIEASPANIALVHSATEAEAGPYLEKFGLADLHRHADPERRLYAAFGLQRGNLAQLFGVKCIMRGFAAGVLEGHGVGPLTGDGFQMPGVFVVRDGAIVREFRHRSAADRPDYSAVARGA